MKQSLVILSLWLCLLANQAFAQAPENIVGKWHDKENPSKQLVFSLEQDGYYYGKVINDNSKPTKNGFAVFRQLAWEKSSQQFAGTVYPPEKDGKEDFKTQIRFINPQLIECKVKVLFFTKTVQFVRLP
jgi:uncharacterized protein (DUF2147 family)